MAKKAPRIRTVPDEEPDGRYKISDKAFFFVFSDDIKKWHGRQRNISSRPVKGDVKF